jgi:hypothetical protein
MIRVIHIYEMDKQPTKFVDVLQKLQEKRIKKELLVQKKREKKKKNGNTSKTKAAEVSDNTSIDDSPTTSKA